MTRRNFLYDTGLVSLGLFVNTNEIFAGNKSVLSAGDFISQRPAVEKRKFISAEVERLITEVKANIKDKELAWMFENCFPNTLDTTVDFEQTDNGPDTFVITGDIDAMWLRDSTSQVFPYMPLITKEEKLKNLIKGLISRQVKCVLRDPYANAFYKDLTKISEWSSDQPKMKPGVHERKWEIDSLCYVIRLAHEYYKISGDKTIFTNDLDKAMRLIVETFKTEQRKNGTSPYWFKRETDNMLDAPPFFGTGHPIKPVGLIASMFRPSDDSTLFPFLIPSNIFAIISLRQLAEIYSKEMNNTSFADECSRLADEVDKAIKEYAITEHLDFGQIYAYEVDGFGNKLFMDDANVPSLISLTYIGANKPTDVLYRQTRKFLLSEHNPYFLKGTAAEGQGGPHTGKENIWPMGIILRAITSTDKDEIRQCLVWLKKTHAGTGFIHESFDKNNPEKFTRKWFAWANTLFGELILKIYHEHKDLLGEDFK